MSRLRHWKIILALLAIFVAGTITGSLLTIRVVRQFANRSAMGPLILLSPKWPAQTLNNYEKRLKLTPEQMTKIKPIFDEAGNELGVTRTNIFIDVSRTWRKLNTQIESELTPEQKTEFEKIREEYRARVSHGKQKQTEK